MKIKSFGLSQEQEQIAADLYTNNNRRLGGYGLEDVDSEMVNVWIADAHSEGEEEYAEFLRKALADGAEIYTLVDTFVDVKQEIGEIAVYDNE